MKTITQIVKSTMERPYIKDVAARKGWTQEETKNKIVDFILCGRKTSLFDFMESA